MPVTNLEAVAPEAPIKPAERFGAGPLPPWVVECAYNHEQPGKSGSPVTHLLLSRQLHAEERRVCVQSAIRLETMEAVQHESQWRLEFDPRTQIVCLHWIRIRRGSRVMDHTRPERCRILQREEALEGFVVDGCCTVLLLLEDVRPGDILEAAYTVTSNPRLLADYCWSFFGLPPHLTVANYYFALRFSPSRPMKWKTSSPDVAVQESTEDEHKLMVWSGANYVGLPAEPNTPEWHIDHPWLQVSDCPDWNTVAAGFVAVWQTQPNDPDVLEIVERIKQEERELPARISRAVRLVQDEFRYLSVDLEMGGHVPAPPGMVARRRYGDCKDLSFLLVHLLRGLGVDARPILVNTRLRKGITDKLPMPGLFDHVVVEVRLAEGPRWVDPTVRNQGGGGAAWVISDYGAGLPVDAQARELVKAPAEQGQSAFELRESLLLDTRGGPSLLAIVVHASGTYAENFRRQFECCSQEDIARERLEACQQRFGLVERKDNLQFRDQRETNEFWLAEIFEIPTPLVPPGEMSEHIRFSLPSNIILTSLAMPENAPRRTPFALPYPCNLTHTIELYSPGLSAPVSQRRQIGNAQFKFVRLHKVMSGFWSVTLQLATLAEAVPPEGTSDFRKLLQDVARESTWEVLLATGYARQRQRSDFGALPPPPRPPGETLVPSAPSIPYKSKSQTGAIHTAAPVMRKAPHRKPPSKRPALSYKEELRLFRRRKKMARWIWAGATLLLIAGLVMLFIFASKH